MIAAASTFKSAFALLETTPRRCACLSPVVPGAACRLCAICFLFSQLVGDLAAVLRELLHHLLVQPDIHRRRIVRVTAIVQFGSKLFARREARVEIEKLHEIDNRLLPVELFLVVGRELGEDGGDIDSCRGHRARRGRRFGAADADVPAGAAPAPGAAPAGAVAALAWPKIVDTIFPRILMELSLLFQGSVASRELPSMGRGSPYEPRSRREILRFSGVLARRAAGVGG
jgi:hypothetical protein